MLLDDVIVTTATERTNQVLFCQFVPFNSASFFRSLWSFQPPLVVFLLTSSVATKTVLFTCKGAAFKKPQTSETPQSWIPVSSRTGVGNL